MASPVSSSFHFGNYRTSVHFTEKTPFTDDFEIKEGSETIHINRNELRNAVFELKRKDSWFDWTAKVKTWFALSNWRLTSDKSRDFKFLKDLGEVNIDERSGSKTATKLQDLVEKIRLVVNTDTILKPATPQRRPVDISGLAGMKVFKREEEEAPPIRRSSPAVTPSRTPQQQPEMQSVEALTREIKKNLETASNEQLKGYLRKFDEVKEPSGPQQESMAIWRERIEAELKFREPRTTEEEFVSAKEFERFHGPSHDEGIDLDVEQRMIEERDRAAAEQTAGGMPALEEEGMGERQDAFELEVDTSAQTATKRTSPGRLTSDKLDVAKGMLRVAQVQQFRKALEKALSRDGNIYELTRKGFIKDSYVPLSDRLRIKFNEARRGKDVKTEELRLTAKRLLVAMIVELNTRAPAGKTLEEKIANMKKDERDNSYVVPKLGSAISELDTILKIMPQ